MSAEPLPSRLVFPLRPIPAKAGLRRQFELPRYLRARMLNEFIYCPRLFFYEWVEGVFTHSDDTVEGALRHETLGETAEVLPPADEAGEERIHSRSVSLSSDRYGLTAKIDLVEGQGSSVTPVDYKRGAPRERDGGLEAWPTDRAQVCVQALVLREHGCTCDEAVVYYNRTKQRVRVPVTDELVAATLASVWRTRAAWQLRASSPLRWSTARSASGARSTAFVCQTRRGRCCTVCTSRTRTPRSNWPSSTPKAPPVTRPNRSKCDG